MRCKCRFSKALASAFCASGDSIRLWHVTIERNMLLRSTCRSSARRTRAPAVGSSRHGIGRAACRADIVEGARRSVARATVGVGMNNGKLPNAPRALRAPRGCRRRLSTPPPRRLAKRYSMVRRN